MINRAPHPTDTVPAWSDLEVGGVAAVIFFGESVNQPGGRIMTTRDISMLAFENTNP
jgi:hypothetical protein